MKKLNKKGFVLAESIVVSVFVLGIFTYLAVNVIPLVTQYDRAINYDNPQEVYAATILFDELVAYINKYDFYGVNEKNYKFVNLDNMEEEYFKILKKMLKIKNINIDNSCIGLGRAMSEYCEYLKNREELILSSSEDSVTIDGVAFVFKKDTILVEFEDGRFSNFIANVKE